MAQTREIQVGSETTPLRIHEVHDVCDPITGRVLTGAWVWDSAFILSQYIVTQVRHEPKFSLRNKTVLELGAGMGLPGLTASKLGANRVVLTDLAPLLEGLKNNVDVNGLSDRVEVCELVWGSNVLPNPLREFVQNKVDLVLMSDLFYDPSLMAPLAKTLKMVCGNETLIWSVTEVRESTNDCVNELASHEFEVKELPRKLNQHLMCGLETIGTNDRDNFVVYLIHSLK